MKHILRALALLSIATPGFAQHQGEAVPTLPTTTVVTGELWESELQKTTASVTVLGADKLEDNGVQHFEDVINAIPNLTWTGGTSRPRYIQIRGIGENSQFEGETPDSTVRFMIDDLDLTGIGSVGNLFDVQQVEVLRGPQAGAFGANAAGGMVRIVTNEPTPYWTGQAEATIGNDDLRAAGIAVGGPLLENDPEQLTFRLALHKLEQNGFRKNKFLNRDDTNERDELTTRLKLRWQPSADWQIDGQLLYADFDNGYDVFTLSNSRTRTFSDEPGRDEQESLGASIKAKWNGDQVAVTSTTGYSRSDSLYSFDGDWGAGSSAPPPFTSFYDDFLTLNRDRDVFSQELRVDSTAQENALGLIDRWTVGLYFQRLDETSNAVWDSGALMDTKFLSESIAIFGQATHMFNDRTRLRVQLRFEYYQVDVSGKGDFYGTLYNDKLSSSDNLWGGNITLEHDLSEKTQAHVSFIRGYKAGGASTPNFTGVRDITYDAETLWTLESGLRSSLFDDAVDLSVTAFYIYREDPQFRDSAGAGSFFDYITTNGDRAHHYGVESEGIWYFAEDWSVSANLGLLKAKRSSYTARGFQVDSRDIANAPNFTYGTRLSYSPSAGLFGNLELLGSDEYFESNSHREKRSAYTLVNASLGYRFNNFTVTFWGKNLFDEQYEDRIFSFNNGGGTQRYESPAAPRTFGVTANYRW
ncbi:MAG: TonB-dependent receptor [Puniceicoccaceae bacterium]|nr:MAG: TonB-dependent receptor [Puniceicoccaceae bacterium]